MTAIAATRSLRGALRKARDTDGQKLVDVQTGAGLDAPITYVANGVLPPTDDARRRRRLHAWRCSASGRT